ncbi:MAG: S8 family serine peptidase [Acidobacteria bacterium]|nr:S8 family serine peptidase [Acidobacteriota bacterium]
MNAHRATVGRILTARLAPFDKLRAPRACRGTRRNAAPSVPIIRAAVWGLVLAVASVAAQDAPSLRALVSELTASPIDRGLRANDPPRDPRTEEDDRIVLDTEPFLRGSLIVKFRPGMPPDARRIMLEQVDGTASGPLPYADFDIVTIDATADPEAVARQLEAQPDVVYAQARYRVYPQFVPNDPLYSRQWNFPALDMERAWDINPGATSAITVAVIDSGVAFRSGLFRFNARAFRIVNGPTFPSLGSVDVPFAAAPELGGADRFVAPRDFIWDDTNPLDLDGHGTHVAGTIGQLTNNGQGGAGMAFNVRIMPVKVIAGDWDFIFNSPFRGTDDVVARGIRYAADTGAKVLNLSIGRTGPAAPAIQEAVAYAVSRGAFVVAAAGNSFLNGNPVERLAEFAPQIDGMVSVASIGRDRLRAFYSTTGPYVELAAPGGNMSQGGTEGGILQQTFDFDLVETYLRGPAQFGPPRFDSFAFEFFQGTSMAAPHVSGFAALLIQQGITSPAAIEAVMKRYATDLGPAGRDDEYGHGLINPRASLRGLGLAR